MTPRAPSVGSLIDRRADVKVEYRLTVLNVANLPEELVDNGDICIVAWKYKTNRAYTKKATVTNCSALFEGSKELTLTSDIAYDEKRKAFNPKIITLELIHQKSYGDNMS